MADTTDSDNLPASPIPGLPSDWPQQATTRVVDVIDDVRTKTTGPAIRVSRAIVYGLVALILVLIALPILLVGLTRMLNYFIPGDIYWVYFLIGAVFTLTGLLLWSRRPRGAARA